MNNVIIVGDNLAKKLSQCLQAKYSPIEERTFPDGELQPRLLKERPAEISILIFRKKRSETINDYLINFFLLSRKLKDISKKVIGIMPYFPYARQDKIFRKGEPFSAKYIAELIEKNIDIFITVNSHEHREKNSQLFSIPVFNLSVFKLLAQKIKEFKLKNTLVIGPDKESKKYVDEFVKSFESQYLIFSKKRDLRTGKIRLIQKKLDLRDKNLIIVDDIISSGGTIIGIIRLAKKFKAKTVSLAFVHGLLIGNAIRKIKEFKPLKMISTNTIENPFEIIEIVPEIAHLLKNKILTTYKLD